MVAWTYAYLFSDGNASTFDCVTHEFSLGDHRRLSACLSFVVDPTIDVLKAEPAVPQTRCQVATEEKREPQVAKKQPSKKKNKKKKGVDDDLIFLNCEVSKVELEKKAIDEKRAISLVKTLQKFSDLEFLISGMAPAFVDPTQAQMAAEFQTWRATHPAAASPGGAAPPVMEKIRSRLKKEAFDEMKVHQQYIDMTNLLVADKLDHWVKDARSYMGTDKNNKGALECLVESPKSWNLFVRTFSQLKFMRMYLSIAFKDMKVHFSRDPYSCIWCATEYFKNFPFTWKISLQVRSNLAIFDEPSIVPFQIGRVMIPKKAKYKEHFQIGDTFLCMPVDRGTKACKEMATSLIDREFTESESEEFNACIDNFTNAFSLSKGEGLFFNFIWNCSADGIFLMAGCFDDIRYHFNVFFERFPGIKKILPVIFSFLRLPNQAFSETIRIHPFFSAVGFPRIPDYLPDSAIDARMLTHFVTSTP